MRNESSFAGRLHRVAPAFAGLCLAALACNAPVAAGTLSDAQILGIYIQVNSFDIETALLGRAQAGSDAVRSLAEHVASDHTGVRQAAYALAAKCDVVPMLPPDRNAVADDHGRTLARLLALKGVEFDTAYLQHEAAFHRTAIDAVRTTLLPEAQCADLQAHFREVLPAFEHHLRQTEAASGLVAAGK